MDNKITIVYGETAIDQLLQWLRTQNRPVTLEALTRRYIEILKSLTTEG
jgi:hypothetical protein